MFEVGFQELVLIALLALIVLGPEKLPKLAAQLGKWTGRARSMARNLRHQLENEVGYDELLKQKQAAEEALRRANEAPMNFHHDVDTYQEPAVSPVQQVPVKEVPVPAVNIAEPPSFEVTPAEVKVVATPTAVASAVTQEAATDPVK
jgi:sec-independent protein translocase protein TatB